MLMFLLVSSTSDSDHTARIPSTLLVAATFPTSSHATNTHRWIYRCHCPTDDYRTASADRYLSDATIARLTILFCSEILRIRRTPVFMKSPRDYTRNIVMLVDQFTHVHVLVFAHHHRTCTWVLMRLCVGAEWCLQFSSGSRIAIRL